MRIGVVSDTHDQLDNVRRIVELFTNARVERVIHTGDITRPATLELFAGLPVPLYGVFGNNDHQRAALRAVATRAGFDFQDARRTLDWTGRTIVVAHDPGDLPSAPPAGTLLLHGHTHRRAIERRGDLLVFNPGECAGLQPGYNAIGVVELDDLSTEILTL